MQRRRRRWGRRRRSGPIGRPPKPVVITTTPPVQKLSPIPKKSGEPFYLDLAEVEALRLVDSEKLSFEEAGRQMNVSRNTVWRLAEGARKKLVQAIIEGREVIIRRETENY